MTKQENGTYTKDYTVEKAYTNVQLKAVKNGSEWIGDETGNNVTFNLTGPGTFTVTYDPEANVTSVSGDIVEIIAELDYEFVNAVGNGEGNWLNGAAWDPAYETNKMNKVADDVWEIEFTNVPDGFERQIKFAIDGAWTHNFGGVFTESGVETGDGVVTAQDATKIQRRGVELETFDATQEALADVNGDGRVSILDVTCIQRYLAEMTEGIGKTGQKA